jgi:histidinol-phosphate phosphatase family protein
MMATRRPSFSGPRAAVFFDRDGTLIHDRHYLKDPNDVELVPDASNAVRYINYALIPVVVVTNQAGIARGLLTEADYQRCEARLDDLLAERNAFIDATYHCPHHPDFTGPCLCRKPGTALYEQAIAELSLDAPRCTYIGDRWHDIVAAKTLGGRGILVPSPTTPAEELERATREMEVAPTLTAAVQIIIAHPHPGAGNPIVP